MTEGWDDVIMHIVKARAIADKLPRNRWWDDTYIGEMTGDSALSELIESAKWELAEIED
jgi:hypothetical protein